MVPTSSEARGFTETSRSNLAQLCSAKFAARFSRGVREWMTTGQTPIIAAPDLRDRSTILKLLQNRQVSSLAGLNQRDQIHEKAL
jgi:hypothetical protein